MAIEQIAGQTDTDRGMWSLISGHGSPTRGDDRRHALPALLDFRIRLARGYELFADRWCVWPQVDLGQLPRAVVGTAALDRSLAEIEEQAPAYARRRGARQA